LAKLIFLELHSWIICY